MKFLVCNNGYLSPVPSGGDNHLLGIGEALSLDHEVTFILPDFASKLLCPAIKHRTYKTWQPHSPFGIIGAYLSRIVKARKAALHEPADVVLASSSPVDIIPALLNRHRHGSCVVVYPFHITHHRKIYTIASLFQNMVALTAQRLAFSMMQHADIIFTDNKIVANELTTKGIQAKKIHLQKPVVNVEAIEKSHALHQFQVLFIGRMVKSKGIFDLVDALKKIPVNAALIGDGEELPSLKKYVQKNELSDRISILGPLPSEKMYALLKGCDLFVFPSYEEGYGIAIAEAIAAKRPIIAYDLQHYREAFNNSLITVPVGDVNALTNKIRSFFEKRLNIKAIIEKYQHVELANKKNAAHLELSIIKTVMRSKDL